MKPAEFESQFQQYLGHIEEAKLRKAHPRHKAALIIKTKEWQLVFNRRTAIERVFGRMKNHRRLNNITVRRNRKVTVHSLIPVIVTQAVALAFPDTPRNCVG